MSCQVNKVTILMDLITNTSNPVSARREAIKKFYQLQPHQLNAQELQTYFTCNQLIRKYSEDLNFGICGSCGKLCNRVVVSLKEGLFTSAGYCSDWIKGMSAATKIGVKTGYTWLTDQVISPVAHNVKEFALKKIGISNGLVLGGTTTIACTYSLPVGLGLSAFYFAGKWVIHKTQEIQRANPGAFAAQVGRDKRDREALQESLRRMNEDEKQYQQRRFS